MQQNSRAATAIDWNKIHRGHRFPSPNCMTSRPAEYRRTYILADGAVAAPPKSGAARLASSQFYKMVKAPRSMRQQMRETASAALKPCKGTAIGPQLDKGKTASRRRLRACGAQVRRRFIGRRKSPQSGIMVHRRRRQPAQTWKRHECPAARQRNRGGHARSRAERAGAMPAALRSAGCRSMHGLSAGWARARRIRPLIKPRL